MRIARIHPSFLLTAALLIALAPNIASAQTSIALSAYGAFSGATTGNGTQQSPSNQAGGLFQLRHTSNPILGFEATYSFNRANQAYSQSAHACPVRRCPVRPAPRSPFPPTPTKSPPTGSPPSTSPISVPSASSGPGYCSTFRTAARLPPATSAKAVYVYGAGLDWGLIPHLGLRLQYRGNLYKAPDLSKLYTSTDAFTHTAEPMVGIYVRF